MIDSDIILGIIIGVIFIGGSLIAIFPKRRASCPTKSPKPVISYVLGSEGIAGEAHFPAEKDGSMPGPLGRLFRIQFAF